VVEFQAQPAPGAWYNLLTKVGLIGEQRPRNDVRGLRIFLHERDDPGLPLGMAEANPPFTAVYLNRFLPERLAREPDNPFVAVLGPLVIERDAELKAQAPRLWQAIQSAPLSETIRERLAEVLQFWLFERVRALDAEEIFAMITQLTQLEETRAYQQIFSKGKAEGEARGESKTLLRLLRQRFGAVPDWAEQRIAAAHIEQLDAWLDGLLEAEGVENLIGPADRP